MKLNGKIIFLLLVNAILFDVNLIVGKQIAHVIPPFTTAFFRWSIASLVLSLILVFQKQNDLAVLKQHWKFYLLNSFFCILICGGLIYWAAEYTTATNIGLVYSSSPLFIILFGALFYSTPIRGIQSVGVVAGFVGIAILLMKGSFENMVNLEFNTGDLLILVASVSWAIYSLNIKTYQTDVSLVSRTLFLALFGSLWLLPMMIYEGTTSPYEMTPLNWGYMLALALCPSVGAFLVYQYVQKISSASTASMIMYIVPLLNTLFSNLILGESTYTYHFIGGGFVLLGVFFTSRSQKV